MSQSPVWWRTLVLSSIVLCIAFAMSASGQSGKSGGTFATVDMQRISNEYKQKQAVEGDLKTMQDKFQKQLDRRDQMPFLTEDEQKQMDAAYDKPAQTDADKKLIKDLTDKAQKLNDEYQTLSQKPESGLDDASKKRMQDLTTQFGDARNRFNAMKDDFTNQVRNFGQSKSDQLMKDIRAAVSKVAEQKGVSIVFDSQVALYAGTDLTSATVAELNKGK